MSVTIGDCDKVLLHIQSPFQTGCMHLRVRKAAVHRNAPAIGRRPPARRRRTVPCDLRRASLPVPPLFSIMFLDTLCSKKWYDVPHIGCGIHSLQWSTIQRLVDIRLVTINQHARCSL